MCNDRQSTYLWQAVHGGRPKDLQTLMHHLTTGQDKGKLGQDRTGQENDRVRIKLG